LIEKAENDLAEIWAYLAAEASEIVASRVVKKIKDDFAQYCDFPYSGPAREYLGVGLRVGFSGRYAVYYQPMVTELVIVRVLHAARDTKKISATGGFG
jgi:plasmid stabilization system protein ParE